MATCTGSRPPIPGGTTRSSARTTRCCSPRKNAKQVGATHFIVVNAKQGGALGGGIMALTQPASAAQATTLIRVMTLERNAEPPMGALAADEIIHFFGPQFGREAPPPRYDPLPQAQDWPAAGAGR